MRVNSLVWLLAAVLGPQGLADEREIRNMAGAMADSIAKSGKRTIAVVDFTDLQGNVTELGRFLAEELSVALAGIDKGFEVVDRTHLKAILAEHKLAATGVIDPATARELGQIAGVDALVTGTITPFGDSVRLTVKGLDTLTARIIMAAATDIPKTRAIDELLAKGIQGGPQPSAVISSNWATGSSPTGTPRPAPANTRVKLVPKAQFRNLIVELLACKREGESVICELSLTSVEKGGEVTLFGGDYASRCRVIDPDGNEHPVGKIRLGPYVSTAPRIELVSDVPMRGAVTITEVPLSVTSFAVIVLRGHFDSTGLGGYFSVEFRGVPIVN